MIQAKISMADIKYYNKNAGQYYFSRSTNKFFGSTTAKNPGHGPFFYVVNTRAGWVTVAVARPNGHIKNLGHKNYVDDAHALVLKLNKRWQRTGKLQISGVGGKHFFNL